MVKLHVPAAQNPSRRPPLVALLMVRPHALPLVVEVPLIMVLSLCFQPLLPPAAPDAISTWAMQLANPAAHKSFPIPWQTEWEPSPIWVLSLLTFTSWSLELMRTTSDAISKLFQWSQTTASCKLDVVKERLVTISTGKELTSILQYLGVIRKWTTYLCGTQVTTWSGPMMLVVKTKLSIPES